MDNSSSSSRSPSREECPASYSGYGIAKRSEMAGGGGGDSGDTSHPCMARGVEPVDADGEFRVG